MSEKEQGLGSKGSCQGQKLMDLVLGCAVSRGRVAGSQRVSCAASSVVIKARAEQKGCPS